MDSNHKFALHEAAREGRGGCLVLYVENGLTDLLRPSRRVVAQCECL